MFKGILENSEEYYCENKKAKIIKYAITLISILGLITFASTILGNIKKIESAQIHYKLWIEQLPPEHPAKQDIYELGQLYELQTTLNIISGVLLDTQKELIKWEFSKLDITELGILEAYLDKKFNESEPKYLLIDANSIKTLKNIKLKKGETCSIKLYRNGEELSFDYKDIWNNNNKPELHELISLKFVKAYIKNPDIARITENQITAISKGKTKLVLIYGTRLLEKDIIVK